MTTSAIESLTWTLQDHIWMSLVDEKSATGKVTSVESALAASVSAGLLVQFVSLVAAPGGMGVPAPLRYMLAAHQLEHLPVEGGIYCLYEYATARGDQRPALADDSRETAHATNEVTQPLWTRLMRILGRTIRLHRP